MKVALRRNPPVEFLPQPQGSVSPQLSFVCSISRSTVIGVAKVAGVTGGKTVGVAAVRLVNVSVGKAMGWPRPEASLPASRSVALQLTSPILSTNDSNRPNLALLSRAICADLHNALFALTWMLSCSGPCGDFASTTREPSPPPAVLPKRHRLRRAAGPEPQPPNRHRQVDLLHRTPHLS
jgi:hypothetical protein